MPSQSGTSATSHVAAHTAKTVPQAPPGNEPTAAPPITSSKLQYRAYIDGLRALAVLAVLAFHAFPEALPGGFAGVDIFFVISGFLISGILLTELRANTFTFAEFYRRRIRRIFPALALVLACCLAFGWYVLLPADYRQLGANAAAGAGFVANLRLWSESGYFDTSAELKPLLHLWSLGVEEQYYLVWPLVLILFRRHLQHVLWMILLIVVGSFAINVFLAIREPTAAFYWPVSRFWELMLGSGLAYLQVCRPDLWSLDEAGSGTEHSSRWNHVPYLANAMAVAGIALVAIGFATLTGSNNSPDQMLLPCVGTTLLILAGPTAWLNRYLLGHPVAVFIGLISYPLYLWHWPLLAYARVMLVDPSTPLRLILLAASGVLAWATYQFVERQVRHATPVSRYPRVVPGLVLSVSLLGVLGLLSGLNALPARSASIPYLEEISAAISDRTYHGETVLRGDSSHSVMFFGDSHMEMYLPRIEQIMERRAAPVRTVIMWTHHGCAPMPGLERKGRRCDEFVDKGFDLAGKPEVDTVVIAASWVGMTERSDYFKAGHEDGPPIKFLGPGNGWILQGFERELKELVAQGKRVVIVLSSPRGETFSPRQMVARDGFSFNVAIPPPVPRAQAAADNAFIDDRLKEIARRVGAELIDPMDHLCTATECPTTDSEGNPLFMDETHLRSSTVLDHFPAFDRYVHL